MSKAVYYILGVEKGGYTFLACTDGKARTHPETGWEVVRPATKDQADSVARELQNRYPEVRYTVVKALPPVEKVETSGSWVKRHAKVGDTVRIVSPTASNRECFEGDVFQIGKVGRFSGYPYPEGKDLPLYHSEYEVLEEAPKKKEEVWVSRQAKAGETIRIVAPIAAEGNYDSGDIFVVDRIGEATGVAYVEEFDWPIFPQEYFVREER